MQNTMMAAKTIASDGVIYWDMGDGKLGMIDVRDVVDAAFAVLTGGGFHLTRSQWPAAPTRLVVSVRRGKCEL